jgi:hypothetical protein
MTRDPDQADPWNAPSWKRAAADYHDQIKKSGRVLIVETDPERLERARKIMDGKVIPFPARIAASTLAAADYLIKQNDPQRLRAWLAMHTAAERRAIKRYLRAKR